MTDDLYKTPDGFNLLKELVKEQKTVINKAEFEGWD